MTTETKVGKIKRLLLERLTEALEDGVLATHRETGEQYVLKGSETMLAQALAAVKVFHAEVGEQTIETASHVEGLLTAYQERRGTPNAKAN